MTGDYVIPVRSALHGREARQRAIHIRTNRLIQTQNSHFRYKSYFVSISLFELFSRFGYSRRLGVFADLHLLLGLFPLTL